MSVLGVLLLAAVVTADETAAKNTAPAAQAAQSATTDPAQAVPEGGMPSYIFPETPERRMQRLGTTEDPGIDPDPNQSYVRFGVKMHIEKFDRSKAAYDRDPGTVRPVAMVNFAYEIYQQNDKYVWVWMPDPEEVAKKNEAAMQEAPRRTRYNDATLDFFGKIRSQFTELIPPAAKKSVRFAESSEGLPQEGSWRNALAVADMNNDGHLDLVAPPERGGQSTGLPSIFLGDGKGGWKGWAVTWPRQYDYGAVAVADFNKDGFKDIALAVHLRGVSVLLADGLGKFVDIREGLEQPFPTRKVTVADVNQDGSMDIVASSEGPTMITDDDKVGRVRAFVNRKKGTSWEAIDVAPASTKFGGDWLTVANLNGDKYPDIVGSSVFYGATWIIYLSEAANKWKHVPSDGDEIPSMSYYFASTSAPFTAKNRDDVILSYVRFWPKDLSESVIPKPPAPVTTNIDRISFDAAGKLKRTPIIRWGGREGIWGLGSGDFDGDGKQDIIYTRHNPREAGLLLGDGNGGFTRATLEGLDLQANINYDIKVADVNNDKKPDVILMYETAGTTAFATRDGAIRVFLNRGAGPAAQQSAKAAAE